jgi:hypothetical protein
MTTQWGKDTPLAVRKLILEADSWWDKLWPTGQIRELLIARMQNIYLLGVNDGIKIGGTAAVDAVRRIGGVK